MSDAEIDFLQKTGKAQFQRAKVYNSQLEPSTSKLRISKSAWLRDAESVVGARVSQRVADMTALSMDTAEDLQVANYGLGGYYTPHYDFNTRNHFGFDERIATVLFYMSDVEQGGATVVPSLGVRVVPRKGTAVFWLNLLPTGEGDRATRHAACPVLGGSKWVATKWVHQLGQELLKLCRSEDQDTRRFPVSVAISK